MVLVDVVVAMEVVTGVLQVQLVNHNRSLYLSLGQGFILNLVQ